MTTTYTPYACSKIVNEVLKSLGVEKTLPPQMFYNYTTARLNAGKEPFIPVTQEGKVTSEDLEKWLKAYLLKNHKIEYVS